MFSSGNCLKYNVTDEIVHVSFLLTISPSVVFCVDFPVTPDIATDFICSYTLWMCINILYMNIVANFLLFCNFMHLTLYVLAQCIDILYMNIVTNFCLF